MHYLCRNNLGEFTNCTIVFYYVYFLLNCYLFYHTVMIYIYKTSFHVVWNNVIFSCKLKKTFMNYNHDSFFIFCQFFLNTIATQKCNTGAQLQYCFKHSGSAAKTHRKIIHWFGRWRKSAVKLGTPYHFTIPCLGTFKQSRIYCSCIGHLCHGSRLAREESL